MTISGHKTRAVFDRYNIVSTDDIMDAMRRLEIAAMNDSARREVVDAGKTIKGDVTAPKKPVRSDSLVKVGRRSPRKPLMALSSRG